MATTDPVQTTKRSDLSGQIVRLPYERLRGEFCRILNGLGFSRTKTEELATVYADNSLDGVYTHGVNRFARFVEYVRDGIVRTDAEPVSTGQWGNMERWDGRSGAGILNALFCTGRAMDIASRHGIGLVGLSNTNHWMRGGTYGRKAADGGYLFIGWTNTSPNMPVWGGADPRIGNNPLVMAVPCDHHPVVLDMAMSQYSFGALETHARLGRSLSVPGGFDTSGEKTTDPAGILATGRLLPAGYWKGSGLAVVLDMFAAVLSGGMTTGEIRARSNESGLSQVFIAIDISQFQSPGNVADIVRAVIEDIRASVPAEAGEVMYPGERVMKTRKQNLEHGIPVEVDIWNAILDLV